MAANRVERLGKCDEVARNKPGPLVDELIEGMLAVRPRLAPIDGRCIVRDGLAIQRDVLAVALHRQLLKVSGKALQILLIRQNSDSLRAEEVVVPKREQPYQHRQVGGERSGAEVLVHLVKAK